MFFCAGELEELRTALEAAERARKMAEGELHEASDRVSELSNQVSVLTSAKRKLETDVQAMQVNNTLYSFEKNENVIYYFAY